MELHTLNSLIRSNEDEVGKWTSIVFPILFIAFAIISCVWFSIAFRKKTIRTKTSVFWITINVIFLGFSVYLLIINLIWIYRSDFPYHKYNIFDWIGKNAFGINKNSWIILLFILLTFVSLVISINITIKFDEQNRKINDLNRNLAILKGKIAIDIHEMNFDTSELSVEELRFLLEEQLAKEKMKLKYKNKLERLSAKSDDVDVIVDTKTLLNIKQNDNIDENKMLE